MHIRLRGDTGLLEEVEAVPRGADVYELSFSPAAVMGLASGDVVRVPDPKNGEWQLVSSGGNVCLQFFVREPTGAEIEACEVVFEPLGGTVDNRKPRVFAATIPRDAGYRRIMSALDRYLRGFPGVKWQFGNVLDQNDRPLPGWESFLTT
jgi:hypothetical protein